MSIPLIYSVHSRDLASTYSTATLREKVSKVDSHFEFLTFPKIYAFSLVQFTHFHTFWKYIWIDILGRECALYYLVYVSVSGTQYPLTITLDPLPLPNEGDQLCLSDSQYSDTSISCDNGTPFIRIVTWHFILALVCSYLFPKEC